jgi:hypothetical protein
MHQDEPFPLDAVPPRVRNAILTEFGGRCPTTGQIAAISDRRWLSTPDIGPVCLQRIHQVIGAVPQRTADTAPALPSEAEFLDRLERMQDELRWIQEQLMARLTTSARRWPKRRWHARAMPKETSHQEAVRAWDTPHDPVRPTR